MKFLTWTAIVAKANSKVMQNVIVNPLFLSSTISDRNRNGNVLTPQLKINMTKENETNGIQLKEVKSTPRDVWNVYRLITARPNEIPNADIQNNIFRPARSTKNVHKTAPKICKTPTTIDDMFDDKVEPDSSKIVLVKFIIAKHPQNVFRAIKTTP